MVAFAAGYVIEHVYSRKKNARHGMPIGLKTNTYVNSIEGRESSRVGFYVKTC